MTITTMRQIAEKGGRKEGETAAAEDGAQRGKQKEMVYNKKLTCQIELQGEEKVTVMELLRCLRELCGGLMACRQLSATKFKVTMTREAGLRRLLDGFKIWSTVIIAKELTNGELVVSFLALPAYIMDEEIIEKLTGREVTTVSPIKRRMWPRTNIADGTRSENDDGSMSGSEDGDMCMSEQEEGGQDSMERSQLCAALTGGSGSGDSGVPGTSHTGNAQLESLNQGEAVGKLASEELRFTPSEMEMQGDTSRNSISETQSEIPPAQSEAGGNSATSLPSSHSDMDPRSVFSPC